jgi:hypothetical protein
VSAVGPVGLRSDSDISESDRSSEYYPPGVVAAPFYDSWHDKRLFLHDVADRDATGDGALTVEVRRHPSIVLAAGYRACHWAAADREHPQDDAYRLGETYDRLTRPSKRQAAQATSNEAGLVAELAWQDLCHLHFADDDSD